MLYDWIKFYTIGAYTLIALDAISCYLVRIGSAQREFFEWYWLPILYLSTFIVPAILVTMFDRKADRP